MHSVLIACPDKIPGMTGGAVQIFETAKGLKKVGYDVFIVTKQYSKQESSSEIRGVKIFRVKPSKAGLGLNALRIARKSLALKPNVILCRDPFYTLTLLLFSTFNFRKVPIIFDAHLVTTPGLKRRRLPLSRLKYRLYDWATKKSVKGCDGVTVQTNFAKECCIKLGAWSEKVFIISPTVDTDEFNFERYKDKSYWKNVLSLKYDHIVTYAGSIDPWQNVEVLIRAIPLVLNEFPTAKFLFLLSKEEDLKTIQTMLKGLENSAIIMSVPHDDIPKYLTASDVFLVSREPNSVMGELEFPTKILEAIAVGVPIVAPHTKAIDEYLTTEEVLQVEPNVPESYAESIVRLLKDEKLRDTLVSNSLRKMKYFSIEYKAMKLQDAIKCLVTFDEQ